MTAALACSLILALAAPGEAIAVTVEVVDASGKPAPGVAVTLATEGTTPTQEYQARMAGLNLSARLLASGRTDEAGRARLERAIEPSGRPLHWKSFAVWARKPGSTLAAREVPTEWPADGVPIRLVVRPSAGAPIRVVDAERAPVASARVAPRVIRGSLVPDGLADELAATTDAEGRAVLGDVDPAGLDEVTVTSAACGLQRVPLAFGDPTARLARAGRVEGRVVADDPAATRGRAITLRTGSGTSSRGLASVVSDSEGRFVVPTLAEGPLKLMVTPRSDAPFLPAPGEPPAVEGGRTTALTISLNRATRVSGVVRDREGGRPIADVGVRLDWGFGVPLLWTDAEGRYSGFASAGSIAPHPQITPAPFYYPKFFLDTFPVAPGLAEFEPPPILLARGGTLLGRVVDEAGGPVAGAEVDGYWAFPSRGFVPVRAISGRDGSFRAEGVKLDAGFLLSARGGGRATPSPVSVTGEGPVTLVARLDAAVALEGRVVDDEGRPVPEARVRLEFRLLGPESMDVVSRGVRLDGLDDLRSDAEGRFRTPRQLVPNYQYRAEAEAPGRPSNRTAWVEPSKGGTTFADLALPAIEPTRSVAGRVVDRQGHPLAGALVEQAGDGPKRTSATTDPEGKFRVDGLGPGPAFLFVSAPGVPFAGHRIDGSAGPVELKARRDGEPVESPLKLLPPPLDRAASRAIARRIMEGEIRRFEKGGEPDVEQYDVLGLIPWVDPALALDLAERKVYADDEINGYLRAGAGEALIADDPDEARAVAESLTSPTLASAIYRKLADTAPEADRAARIAALDQALLHARAAPDPADRLDEFGKVALRLLALGEPARASALLAEGKALALSLGGYNEGDRKNPGAHARGRFAAKLARVDAEGAFDLARGYDPASYQNWYAGGVALGLAARDAAGAERALGLMPDKAQRDFRVVRLVGRMAASDPARARRLVDALENPVQKLSALTSMARGLVATDPASAAKLVDEVLDGYLAQAREGRALYNEQGGSALSSAMVLPVAASLDPARLERAFWTVVALRPPRPAGADPASMMATGADARIALYLARHDRAVARQVLDPVARRVRALEIGDRGRIPHPAFAAAAAIDPAWAVALIDSLPEDGPTATVRPKALARRGVVEILTRGEGDRDYVDRFVLYLTPDDPDDER